MWFEYWSKIGAQSKNRDRISLRREKLKLTILRLLPFTLSPHPLTWPWPIILLSLDSYLVEITRSLRPEPRNQPEKSFSMDYFSSGMVKTLRIVRIRSNLSIVKTRYKLIYKCMIFIQNFFQLNLWTILDFWYWLVQTYTWLFLVEKLSIK